MDINYIAIGHRIKYLRKLRGLTQEALAEMAGISFAFVGHIERGTRKMSVETLFALARALDCSVDYLLDNIHTKSSEYVRALQRVAEFVRNEIEDASKE